MTDYYFANQIVPYLSDDETYDYEFFTAPTTTIPTTVATTTETFIFSTEQSSTTTTRRPGNTGYKSNCITRRCRILEERFAKRQNQALRNDRP